MNQSSKLFPPIDPFDSGFLSVSSLHKIYYERSGNPDGKPVIVCHGGPGGGSTPSMRRYFDPERYHITIFDQRGCGRSTPNACLEENTTWDLVADMEALREKFSIEKWQVFGGSWGSTLALAYGQTHPERVSEFVLRGIFTLRREELLWFYQDGAHWFLPEAWDDYISVIPEAERDDLIGAYYRRLTGDNDAEKLKAAQGWSRWEGGAISLLPAPERVENFASEKFAIAFARIESHYFVNGGFFERDDQIIANIDRVRHIPSTIVQGRYDIITPIKTAWDLYKAWPEAQFKLILDAGHAVSEPGITDALIKTTNHYATS